MSRPQYEANKSELGLSIPIRPSVSKKRRRIGRPGTVVGEAYIESPFKVVGIVLVMKISILN